MSLSIPLPALAKILEDSEGSKFRSILQTLRSVNYVNQSLLKSDIAVFIAKVLKLLRSNDPYQIWKGCHVVSVFCSHNPVVLCSQSNQLLTVLYTRLEAFVSYYSETAQSPARLTTLKTLTRTVDILMDLIRGKPTLTREALTPKLNAIIPLLINLCQYEPKLCLPIIKKLLLQNTTTFKPFANKYRTLLTTLITKDFQMYDGSTQKLICDNYAYLHLIKQTAQTVEDNQSHHKTFLDENWRSGLLSVLQQFKPLITLCGDILDFTSDSELLKMIDSLPTRKNDQIENYDLFSPLAIDLNKSFTLWELTYRMQVLSKLLISFISLPTPFPLRVPLHGIINVCQSLLGLSTNYLPLKRGLRRETELTSVIYSVLRNLQYQGVVILKSVTKSYGKSVVFYYSSILSSLELFIPLKTKGTSIDFAKVDQMKEEVFQLLHLINIIAENIGHKVNEIDFFTKLTDVTLYLVKDKSNLHNMFTNVSDSKISKQTTKHKKDINKAAGAMADIYSHPKQFILKTDLPWFEQANKFLSTVVKNWKLPSTQQVNIIKYATVISITLKERFGAIPASFEDLLSILVLYPGNERVSILPIAIRLLKGSDNTVFEVLCNPRLPLTSTQSGRPETFTDNREELKMPDSNNFDKEEDEEDADDDVQSTELFNVQKESTQRESISENGSDKVDRVEIVPISSLTTDNSNIFRKRAIDETVDIIEEASSTEDFKRSKMDQSAASTGTSAADDAKLDSTSKSRTISEEENDEEDSEFEIPIINLSDNENEDSDLEN